MGMIYAHNGDRVVVQDHGMTREFEVRISGEHPHTRNVEFVSIPLCIACQENDAEFEMRLCSRCVHDVLAFTQLATFCERVNAGAYSGDIDDFIAPELQRAIAECARVDIENAQGGISYVDTESASCDWANGEDVDSLGETFGVFARQYIIPHIIDRRNSDT